MNEIEMVVRPLNLLSKIFLKGLRILTPSLFSVSFANYDFGKYLESWVVYQMKKILWISNSSQFFRLESINWRFDRENSHFRIFRISQARFSKQYKSLTFVRRDTRELCCQYGPPCRSLRWCMIPGSMSQTRGAEMVGCRKSWEKMMVIRLDMLVPKPFSCQKVSICI